jgi:hypothetical protein
MQTINTKVDLAADDSATKYLMIARTYLTEHFLCALFTIFVYLIFTNNQISIFLSHTSDEFIKSILVPALAAVLVFLWTFYNKADGKFTVWLQVHLLFISKAVKLRPSGRRCKAAALALPCVAG